MRRRRPRITPIPWEIALPLAALALYLAIVGVGGGWMILW